MKFLPLRDFDVVTSALNFDTPDCHVTGGCDLYTTKAAGGDKKLYKNIDKSLESQHESLLKFGASLSPPQRQTLNLTRSSPFGNLSEISSRKTFAYLIATLNASHPDYDFSHVLRPGDFKRERPLRKITIELDTMLHSARPGVPPTVDFPVTAYLGSGKKSKRAAAAASGMGSSPPAVSGTDSPAWGPHMWALIDKEMTLKDCSVWSYQPANNPFEEEASAIWSMHYFFFNKERKRVAYLYARGVPVVSHSASPQSYIRQRSGAVSITPSSSSGDLRKRRLGMMDEADANKRARYWLGDRAERATVSDEEFDGADDGLTWNRDSDGVLQVDDFAGSYDDGYDEETLDDFDEEFSEEEADDEADDEARTSVGPVVPRGVSEDIAGRMEIE
ncbi:RNA polymerase III-inhibiting protein maf1 [Gnomoniopsis smithogilvyi]|uniref:Repressor of RNA polymerase III transcription MAF1 n=1 Tax=Gnomoniopsis smithogilvyi TaxID=1191159 RepID=A0A9W8Z0M7_9PEZI|nr:RNA polymerase III-inhibiting protein maf1 [Gnomoniopsis smithogilvyi]